MQAKSQLFACILGLTAGGSEIRCFLVLQRTHVNRPGLAAVLWIRLSAIGDLLTLFKGLKSVCLDSGKMYEYIVAALIVRDEAKAFVCVKPLYCTIIHNWHLLKYTFPAQNQKITCFCKPLQYTMTYKNM